MRRVGVQAAAHFYTISVQASKAPAAFRFLTNGHGRVRWDLNNSAALGQEMPPVALNGSLSPIYGQLEFP